MKRLKLILSTIPLVFAGTAGAQSVAMKPGLWEISIAEHAPATATTRTTTARVCYSADDVKSVERIVPVQRTFGTKCDNRDIRAGAKVSWNIVCKGKDGNSAGTASMVPATETYAAQALLEVKTKGKESKVEQTITGKRVGECK